MCCVRITNVHQVISVALSASEFAVAGKFVVMEAIGIAQVVLRENVSAKSLVAAERKHARRIDGIGFERSLDGGDNAVFRLNVFVFGNVLDERSVDGHEFDAGNESEDADLGWRASFPFEYSDAYANHDENEYETRDNLCCGCVHHDFIKRLEVRGCNRIVQELLSAHEEHADDCKTNDNRGLHASGSPRKLCLECIDKILDIDLLVLVVEAHHAETCSCVSEANDKAERADKECPVESCNHDEQK